MSAPIARKSPARTILPSLLLSLLVAYAFFPFASMGALVLEPHGFTLGFAVLAGVWLVQGIALITSFICFLRIKDPARRVANGLFTAGFVLFLSVLLCVIAALQESRYSAGAPTDGIFGTILSGVLFSGQYGLMALVFLIAAAILHRRRQ